MERISKIFKKAWKKLRLADGLSLCLAALILAGAIFVVPAGASSTQVDSNVGGQEVTLSRFAEIISQAFAHTMSAAMSKGANASLAYISAVDTNWVAADGDGAGYQTMSLGNIGNVLGYLGDDEVDDAGNIWTKGTDAASKVMTLQSVGGFYNIGKSDGDVVPASSNMMHYIIFGSALNNMGIDEFRDAQSNADGIRTIIGYATYVFYILAYSASGIMNSVLDLLKNFNIFNIFYDAAADAIRTLGGFIPGGSVFLEHMSQVMDQLKALRWIILAIMIVVVVASVTVWKGKGYNQAATIQGRWRKILYRFVIMIIGIPLIGMVYSAALDLVDYTVDNATYSVTNYIFQEFLDFESWTVTNNPDHNAAFKVDDTVAPGYNSLRIVYNTKTKQYEYNVGSDSLDVSRFVYAINASNVRDESGNPVIDTSVSQKFLRDIFGSSTGGGGAATDANFSSVLTTTSGDKTSAYKAARNIILRYARSATVVPDMLNDAFQTDYLKMADDSWPDASAATAATIVEQLFGVNSAEQRIWSYVSTQALSSAYPGGGFDPTDPKQWLYPNDRGLQRLSLAVDEEGHTIDVRRMGLAFAGCVGNYVLIGSASGMSDVAMHDVLRNGEGNNAKTISVSAANVTDNFKADGGATFDLTYDLSEGGMSPLALYNYMHTRFEDGTIAVYSPDDTTNAGVGMMHYSVTTPYSGIPELVQLLYVVCILFSIGIIGWVFGVSLLMNTIVQTIKALPIIFKVVLGSVQGFVEGLLTVLSICAEILVTIFLYSESINIIDLLIKLVSNVVKMLLSVFTNAGMPGVDMTANDPETYAIMSGLLSMLIILWGTFELIKWRQAITMTIKSILTHTLNTVFGTSAEMPTGASSGMMKAAAGLAAGAMVAGALAENGSLEDVVNDLTDSDLGSDVHDKLSEGDFEGAMDDVKSYAAGDYPRGRSATADAEAALGDGSGGVNGVNGWQSLTDDQNDSIRNDDEIGDAALADANEAVEAAEKTGDADDVAAAEAARDDILQKRADKATEYRHANYAKAQELGVADYGDYLREQDAAEREEGNEPVQGLGDAIPEKPESNGQPTTLSNDAQMAYTAARDGDEQTLRTAAQMYDSNGLTKEQADELNQKIIDNPDMTKEDVADEVDRMAQENFGDDHEAVVDKINEAAHRDALETYGDTDNSDGNARTIGVGRVRGKKGQYKVNDNSSDEDVADATVEGTDLPVANMPSAEAQQAYDAVRSGDINNIKAAAANFDGNGLTQEQHATIETMVGAKADGDAIQSKIDEFAKENFGDNAELIIDKMNEAKGVSGSETYTAAVDGAPNVARNVVTGGGGDGFTESYSTLQAGDNTILPNASGAGGVDGSGYGQGTAQMMSKNAVLAGAAGVAAGQAMGGGAAGTVINGVRGGGVPTQVQFADAGYDGSAGTVNAPGAVGNYNRGTAQGGGSVGGGQGGGSVGGGSVGGVQGDGYGGGQAYVAQAPERMVMGPNGQTMYVPAGGPSGGIGGGAQSNSNVTNVTNVTNQNGDGGSDIGGSGGGVVSERETTVRETTVRESGGDGGIGDLSKPYFVQMQDSGSGAASFQVPLQNSNMYVPYQQLAQFGPMQQGGGQAPQSVTVKYDGSGTQVPTGTAEDIEAMAAGTTNIFNNTQAAPSEDAAPAEPVYDEYGEVISGGSGE